LGEWNELGYCHFCHFRHLLKRGSLKTQETNLSAILYVQRIIVDSIVDKNGDEITRVVWQWFQKKLIIPYVVKIDPSLHCDAANGQVTIKSALLTRVQRCCGSIF